MNHTRLEVSFFLLFILGISVLVFFIFKPYFVALFLAVVFAIISKPVYHFFLRRLRGYKSLASFITVIFVLMVILTPLTFFSVLLFDEARDLYFRLSADEFNSFGKLAATLEEIGRASCRERV